MRICLAPMDGITDCAYRIICKEIFEQHGHTDDELMLRTEFMSADGYVHNPPGVIKHILKSDYDHETIAQIFGGNTETLIACAQDIDTKYDFSGIELNMGCPSPKIMKCAAGSGMLKDKKKTLTILEQISKSISTPFSLKTRIGLTQDDVEEQFDFLVEASKYVRFIAVHGRTYKQSHSGEVNRNFLYKLKERLPNTVIIGNGGIRSYEQAQQLCSPKNNRHCEQNEVEAWQSHPLSDVILDGTMIAQSAIGNPWIMTPHTPTPSQRYTLIMRHLNLSVACELYFESAIAQYDHTIGLVQPTLAHLETMITTLPTLLQDRVGPPRSVVEFRKYLFNYVVGLENSKKLKQHIAKTREYQGLVDLLEDFFKDKI